MRRKDTLAFTLNTTACNIWQNKTKLKCLTSLFRYFFFLCFAIVLIKRISDRFSSCWVIEGKLEHKGVVIGVICAVSVKRAAPLAL